MRLVKMLGLAAIAALVAIAAVGASTASAEFNTSLCKVLEGLECPAGQQWKEGETIHLVGSGTLLSSLNVLCLDVLGNVEVEGASLVKAPEKLKVKGRFTYSGCGTTSSHNNCTVTALQDVLFDVLKTAEHEGVGTGLEGLADVECKNILGFITIACEYDASELTPELGGAELHVTLASDPAHSTGKGGLCPETSSIDALLETLEAKTANHTGLCKSHSSPCKAEDQAKGTTLSSTESPVFYNTVANVECESSSVKATTLPPAETQKLDVTEMSWKGCHTQGAADNCAVTATGLPTLDLKTTELNLGEATSLGLKIGIECLILDLIELDCEYGSGVTLPYEGALHKEGVGHGRLTASKLVLTKTSGEGHCPDSVKWDAAYEPSEHLYLFAWTVEEEPVHIAS